MPRRSRLRRARQQNRSCCASRHLKTKLFALAILAPLCAACVPTPPMQPLAAPILACRAASVPMRWILPDAPRDRRVLDSWCRTVGPPAIWQPPSAAPSRLLAIVSWNVHEDAGDVIDLVRALRTGELTGGARVDDVILLLQEAFRHGSDVPPASPSAQIPTRIARRHRPATQADVIDVAHALDASIVYVPSMRNGRIAPEDRGNAILSTIPLDDITAIELPFEHQRRVAVAASVHLGSWTVRVASVHLDTTAAIRRAGPLSARSRQARALIEALGGADLPTAPIVIGGDFNTWFGRAEPAYRVMARQFTDPLPRSPITWTGPMHLGATLDHFFVRIPPSMQVAAGRRIANGFGSDHYPLLLQIRF